MKIFLPVFSALSQANIRYVTVGGFATVLHGFLRATGDIDLVLDMHGPNLVTALNTLKNLGFRPRAPVDILDFASPEKREEWVTTKGLNVFSVHASAGFPLEVDLFVTEPIPFDELFARSKLIPVENELVRVASIDDIIALKTISGRPKDLADIEALKAIKANETT